MRQRARRNGTRRTRPDAARRTTPERSAAPPALPLPEPHDVRRKRPPALSFLLRMDTLRRVARVVVAAGARLRRRSSSAIFTALWLKAAARDALDRRTSPSATRPRTTCRSRSSSRALLFARSGLYADRAQRPGPDAHRRLAVPGDGRGAALRARQRPGLLELLHLLRLAVLRASPTSRPLPLRLRARRPARCCAPRATSAARCSSAPASTSRTSRTRSPAAATRP